MKTIYPVDKEGLRIGPDEVVSDEFWEKLRTRNHLRWRLSDEYEKKLKAMKKKELVDFYDLPEEDMKLRKDELLTKIKNL